MTDDQVILFLVFWLRIPGSSEHADWKLEVVLHIQDFIFNNMQLSFHYFKIFFLWASIFALAAAKPTRTQPFGSDYRSYGLEPCVLVITCHDTTLI